MKTIKQCKDEVAAHRGYANFNSWKFNSWKLMGVSQNFVDSIIEFESFMEKAMQEYAEAYHEDKEREREVEAIGFAIWITVNEFEHNYNFEPKWVHVDNRDQIRISTDELYDKYKSETNK